MTLPNYITIFRFLLIPVFIGAFIYYDDSIKNGHANEIYRWVAVASFVTASISDAIDGYLARKLKQKSILGSIMDPLADKALILSAIIILSIVHVPGVGHFPLWLPILIISRDIILVFGSAALFLTIGEFHIKPHWTGKVATCFLMVAITIILLKLQWAPFHFFVIATGIFIFASMILYIRRGLDLIHASHKSQPHSTQ